MNYERAWKLLRDGFLGRGGVAVWLLSGVSNELQATMP